ncbi:MAG TPA: hypothetical protein VFB14_27870 [Bryobacteraceae bacterium]|nr:hypothetical protein [Bryobacteraceae bacterium]
MQVSPQAVQHIQAKSERYPGPCRLERQSDILTDLEVAAAVAQTIPAAAPYAALGSVVIAGTQQAVAAETAVSGSRSIL